MVQENDPSNTSTSRFDISNYINVRNQFFFEKLNKVHFFNRFSGKGFNKTIRDTFGESVKIEDLCKIYYLTLYIYCFFHQFSLSRDPLLYIDNRHNRLMRKDSYTW